MLRLVEGYVGFLTVEHLIKRKLRRVYLVKIENILQYKIYLGFCLPHVNYLV